MNVASHAGVFRGARISSLPTNAVCGREEIRAPLKTPAWEATLNGVTLKTSNSVFVNRSSFKSVLNFRKAYIFKSLLKVYYRSAFNKSSKAFIFQKCAERLHPVCVSKILSLHIFLWKVRATPGVCIKPGCLARTPLFHKVNLPASCGTQRLLCHKVNLLSCVARRL